ncbi:MAG TPA: AAA domain-containing protein [candidate division Zixibacteria bacterium]|nr:AAA domain-containing protein [candidate division Zixibacteria bacterium]
MSSTAEKTTALLRFLRDTATLRRKRIAAYGADDKLLWFHDVPRDLPQTWRDACKSAFISDNPDEFPDLWLEVRKKRRPVLPPLPTELQDWVPRKFQDDPGGYLDKTKEQLLDLLNPEITVLVEKRVQHQATAPGENTTVAEKVPEVRRLVDYPNIQDAWLEYLGDQWEPWAEETRRWKQVQRIYEDVDFMRRRIEEAEERYELRLAVGLLQWRDSTATAVKRHLLTAPAEISLDAARGILTVGPAASFDGFRVELDMLELHDQPRLDTADTENRLEERLDELDVRGWDKTKVAEILRVIANKAASDAQVSEDVWTPLERADATFRVSYAPALVLRERRPTAYEELIGRFLKASEGEAAFSTTPPWDRFVSEGGLSGPSGGLGVDINGSCGDMDRRLYFPLAKNDEQRRIAERLRNRPYVLVKGPPGTGKSHTIANLICHLLAIGERVLVTAHAPKALTVLRDLLPGDIRNLCVTAFGSSREDHRLLEDSVRGILSRKNEWMGQKWAQEEIDRLEKELCQHEQEAASLDRQLRECREAETYSHSLPGGYTGTAAQIARQLEEERETHGWFPELAADQDRCPLSPDDIMLLAEVHPTLTQERLNELTLDIGAFDLPDPQEFTAAIEKLSAAEREAEGALDGVPEHELGPIQNCSDANLEACRTFLVKLEELVTRASRTLGDLTGEILKDLIVGQDARWNRLERETVQLVERIQIACERAGAGKFEISSDTGDAKLLADTCRRLEHFRRGGRRGWGFLAPRIARETRYIEERCRVNGGAPRDERSLDMLAGYLELRETLDRFYTVWPKPLDPTPGDPRHAAGQVCDLVQQTCHLTEFFRKHGRDALEIVPATTRITLSEHDARERWCRLIKAELARRLVRHARRPIDGWAGAIRGSVHHKAHPCMSELAQAIEARDPAKWNRAWTQRESLKTERDRFQRYQELLERIYRCCPELARVLQPTRGDPRWKDRLRRLEQTWDWAATRAWLHRITDSGHYERLARERQRLQDRIEKKLEKLAAVKAWQAFFLRLDDQTEQNLTAWTKAVARIGKNTGKYAYRHRRAARRYLMSCIPKMPAWIMPLHKLWETTDPTPGLFDTVIVDEASQAGIEALALLLLAKRIIVVGDDKQNSPEAVGVLEDDIARLARDYLREFRFRDEFRPDTSLYDHAERAFGNLISLREHFRCVPEIIRFSNELCYTDAPLIPLRQPPPKRLPPLKTKYVNDGFCQGEGQRILNPVEADAIVAALQNCLEDDTYEGKTMGVIVLQGHAQAELIERRLAEMLEPKVREERRLRCGTPATFQGDQRDVIFLSLVVAPNHHFRALTGLPDQRRFNVAMSRARDQVWLFHSVQLHDLSREDLRWKLLNFFYNSDRQPIATPYEELLRLERELRHRSRRTGEQPSPYESWFEVDVALELLRRKYRIRPQVEVAGYRIDLVVEGLDNRLAIECDGEAWHGPDRFDQDMARQRQLERAGWTFVRVRESEFYAARDTSMHRVTEACEELGIRPIGEDEIDEEQTAGTPREKQAEEDEGFGEQRGEALDNGGEDRRPASLSAYPELSEFPDPRDASPINVRAALRRIIEREGPLTKRLLIRLYVAGCPALERASKNVRSLLNRNLSVMQRAGEIVVEDELGDRTLESQVLRLRGAPKVRERSAGQRDLLEIPASEIFLVLDRLCRPSDDSAENQELLYRSLLEHYGFSRLTEGRRRHLTKILDAYRRRGMQLETGGSTDRGRVDGLGKLCNGATGKEP